MGEKQTKSIADAVLDRRAAFEHREMLSTRALQRHIEDARKEIRKELRLLRAQTDPETGALLKNEAVERALKAESREMSTIWKRNMRLANDTLIRQRRLGFEQGVADVAFTVEEATAGAQQLSVSFSQVFEEAAHVSANAPVLGVNPGSAMRGIQFDMERRTRDALTRGFLRGESIDKIAKRITDATDIGKRAAVRVARTNLNASVNEASRLIYDSDPIFSGYQWDSVFDARTSLICASLHGRIFPKGSTPPGPPAHPNCRSVLIPIFTDPDVQKFASEGGRRVRRFDKDGERIGREVIDSNRGFDAWLRSQNSETTKRFFRGREVANGLFRSGRIGSQDFVSADLIPRSDNGLIQRAWSRRPGDAGLKAQAEGRGLGFRSAKSFEAADRRVQGRVRHSIGTRKGMSRMERARLQRLDARKKRRTRDVVRAAARRQGSVD